MIPLISLVRPGAGRSLRERMGSVRPVSGKKGSATLWIHAASVGEVQAAGVLINELLSGDDKYNIVLTTMTGYGLKVAKAQLPGNVSCFLVPFDVPYAVRRFLGTIRPDIYIGLETELWPVLLTEIRHAGVPGVLLNGRMSQRSFKRYRLVHALLTRLLSGFSTISVISNLDKERFAFFGIPEDRILVTGNIKYDFTAEDRDIERKKYRILLGLKEEKLFICGSTRSGEEKILAEVFRQLQEQSGRGMVWLVAPRHLERLAEVKRLLEGYGLSYDLFTELKDKRKERENSIILVDSMGELARIYSAGDYIFCGGSFVDEGGHNVMEAARWGLPVYYGPSMYDFMD
ncbi:MAG: hypothetical protein OEM01_07410, partial [Desulfobulbaceae bacterium]|nr:hypothetical protein [Desulfobulbaceae bacterium]